MGKQEEIIGKHHTERLCALVNKKVAIMEYKLKCSMSDVPEISYCDPNILYTYKLFIVAITVSLVIQTTV